MSKPARTETFLFVLPYLAGITGTCHHFQPLVEMESHELFAQAGLEI
jgi:hypothetical protein